VVKGRVRDGWVGFRNDAEVDVILQANLSQFRYVNRAEYHSGLLFSDIFVNHIRLDPGFLKVFRGANSLTRLAKKARSTMINIPIT
jgi:hypothetical protein